MFKIEVNLPDWINHIVSITPNDGGGYKIVAEEEHYGIIMRVTFMNVKFGYGEIKNSYTMIHMVNSALVLDHLEQELTAHFTDDDNNIQYTVEFLTREEE